MNLRCLLGAHTWSYCRCIDCGKSRNKEHNWVGCMCSVCRGARDEGHDWSGNCEECSGCRKKRVKPHEWNGCKCVNCCETRDKLHQWNGCKCANCRKRRDELHQWPTDREECSICGQTPDDLLLKICDEEVFQERIQRAQIALLRGVKNKRSLVKVVLSNSRHERISYRIRGIALLLMNQRCELCYQELNVFSGSEQFVTVLQIVRQPGFCPSCQTVMCMTCGGVESAALTAATSKFSLNAKCPKCKTTLVP